MYVYRVLWTLLLTGLALAAPDFGRWYPLPQAQALAQAHGRVVMVYFHSPHCPYCDQMNTFVLSDPAVSRLLEERFVVASVGTETPEGQELARRFRVPGTPTFVFLVPRKGRGKRWAGFLAAGPGRSSWRSCARCVPKEVRVNRRAFLKATGVTLGAVALSGLPVSPRPRGRGPGQSGKGPKGDPGQGIQGPHPLRPGEAHHARHRRKRGQRARRGGGEPAFGQVKVIHLFADKNPTPLLVSFMPMKALPYYATRVRLAETTAIRAVVETADGKLLLASASTRVTVGGCG